MVGMGQRLRKLRGDRRQAEIARALGIGTSSYTMYENDQREPNYKTLCQIADYYNVPTDYLLGRTGCYTFDIEEQAISKKTGLTGKVIEQLEFLVTMNEKAILAIANSFLSDFERMFDISGLLNKAIKERVWEKYIKSHSNEQLKQIFGQKSSDGITRVELRYPERMKECEYQIDEIMHEWIQTLVLDTIKTVESTAFDLQELKLEIDIEAYAIQKRREYYIEKNSKSKAFIDPKDEMQPSKDISDIITETLKKPFEQEIE